MDEEEANRVIKVLDKTLAQKRAQVRDLQEKIDTLNTKKANLSFQLEREQVGKRNFFWWILLLSLELLKFTASGARQFLIVLMCEYAFLAMWRGFYVKHTKHAVPVAICVVAISLYFI
jgi:hypothetical protein